MYHTSGDFFSDHKIILSNLKSKHLGRRLLATIRVSPIQLGGDDWHNFKPKVYGKTLSFSRLNRIIMELRRIHKENPANFDVPAFVQKVYDWFQVIHNNNKYILTNDKH